MRFLLAAVVLVGCSDSEIDAPDDCAVNELHVINGAVDERVMISNFAFVNRLNDSSPGYLDVGVAPMVVHIEFDTLAANGDTVDARGSVILNGLDVGNCDADGFPSLLLVDDGSWRFQLRDIAMAPYCGGPSVSASLHGCDRAR